MALRSYSVLDILLSSIIIITQDSSQALNTLNVCRVSCGGVPNMLLVLLITFYFYYHIYGIVRVQTIGSIEVAREELKMSMSTGTSSRAASFSTRQDMESGSDTLLGLILLRSLCTPQTSTTISGIEEKRHQEG